MISVSTEDGDLGRRAIECAGAGTTTTIRTVLVARLDGNGIVVLEAETPPNGFRDSGLA